MSEALPSVAGMGCPGLNGHVGGTAKGDTEGGRYGR
jgi:hypothetical protein